MRKRLMNAFDTMTMPEDCTRRIEQQLVKELRKERKKETKPGREQETWTMRAPVSSRRSWWGAAAGLVCLVLLLLVPTFAVRGTPRDNTLTETFPAFTPEETTQISETPEDFYCVATDLPAQEIEQFADRVRKLVLESDWNSLAVRLHYPITIDGAMVEDAVGFVDLILARGIRPAFVAAMEEESCRQMFCNWQGISMGDAGQVWFSEVIYEDGGSGLKITAINGMVPSTSDYEYEEREDGTIAITKYLGMEEAVVVPSTIDGKKVTAIGDAFAETGAFQDCRTVTSVEIAGEVTVIGNNTFQSCHNLETVILPETVTGLAHCVFDDCPNLRSVYFNGDAPATGNYVFTASEKLTIYYREDTEGWTNPWYGCNTQAVDSGTQAGESRNTIPAEFIGILLENHAFYSHDFEKEMSIAEYCETFGAGSDITVEVPKFTVVDMDGDGVSEVVLWIRVNGTSDYGTMVLRYQDGKVYGTSFAYRQLFNLRKDGSFDYSGGGDNDGSAVLKFTQFDCYSEKISRSDQDEKAFAQWHIYPCGRADVVLESYEYASEEWGSMLGSQFWYFEELAKGNRENNWDSLKESLARDGMVYTDGEGVFSVYDPGTPGCWMYGVLTNVNGFDQLAEMGYYVCNENGEFQAEIRDLLSDTPAYAIDVTLGSGGTEVPSVDDVFNYFGQEELNSGGIRDALQIRALMDDFALHYFANDMEDCDCLADTFAGRVEGYSPSGEPTIISHKGLPTEAMQVGDTCSVSLELLEPGQTDSYSYLSMELIRQENGWKVRSYALEK